MWCINHLEWCVSDINGVEKLLSSHFGYRAIAERVEASSVQRFLALGDTRLLLTQRIAGPNGDPREHTYPINNHDGSYPFLFCCEDKHERDSVFNVAIAVGDFETVVERLKPSGKVLCSNSEAKEALRYVLVQAPCENVTHIIMDRKCSDVLPGFSPILATESTNEKDPFKSDKIIDPYFDHVTYVVPMGSSVNILNWYSEYLGMKRFLVQPGELPEKGVEITGEVGLRLMVGEWLTSWSCREVGVRDPGSSVMLVLAEPLRENSDSHVQKFLNNNQGPGVQHVGLALKSGISTAVQEMIQNGCNFQKPPPTYYQLPSKILEIRESGEDFDTFSKLGLLIDSEADYEELSSLNGNGLGKYLIQIFTKPLFKEDTFFMEVLERRGARGFGSGNIVALAESIVMYNKCTDSI